MPEVSYDYTGVPTIGRFSNSDAFIRGLMGPFGSGKSSGCVVEFPYRGKQQRPNPRDGIRRTRGAVIRNCFDDRTEILTEARGWQLFRDLLPEDRVATLLRGEELTYERPSYYYAAHYSGEMIGARSDGLDMLVTPDHRLWTSKRVTRAKDWAPYKHEAASAAYGRSLRRFKRDAIWRGGSARYSEDFYEFLGFWFAEGYAGAYNYKDRKEPHYRFVVVQKEVSYPRDLLLRAGLEWGEGKGHGVTHFRIRVAPEMKALVRELAGLGHAHEKRLPQWLRNAPAAHAMAFLRGYWRGDGSKRTSKSCSIRAQTASARLADDIQELCLRAGMVANVGSFSIKPRPKGFKASVTSMATVTFLSGARSEPTARGWYKADYDGMVYCVEVSSHVVYVRRNGKAHWSGQTFKQLEDTTIKTFHQWLPPAYFGRYTSNNHRYLISAFPQCEIEILYRALDKPDDVKDLLSLDLSFAWVNEAREVPWVIIEALMGRVGRYPGTIDGGCTWSGIWADTNPPDSDSRWYKFFEEEEWLDDYMALKHARALPPGLDRPEDFAALFKQPSGMSAAAENLDNLQVGYYARLGIGKTEEWKKVYIHGRYGFVSDNKTVFPEFKDELHIKAKDPIPGITIERNWDFGLCYSDDTEVLTFGGWKLFKDVDCQRDLVATRDPRTGAMEYTQAAFKIAKPYKGEMLEWSSTELNICVTPEHRVPFTYRDSPRKIHWQSAEWLATHMGGHHYVDLVSAWMPPIPVPAHMDGMEALAWAEFMGLYLSEGSATARGQVLIYQSKQRVDMERILDHTGLAWKWFSYGKTSGWRTHNRPLAASLRAFGTARAKRVPHDLRFLPPHHIRAFVMAYTMGDGHIRTRQNGAVEHVLFTSSKGMADDMQDLAQKAGWNSSMRVVKPSTSVMDGRKITNTGGFSITFKKTATRAELLRRNFKRVQYDGMIYCLSVPHHTLYVRRGGKPSWNGNTPACTFSCVLPTGQWLVFQELIAANMGVDRFSDEVLEFCAKAFKGPVQFDDLGDPSGDYRKDTDEKTCFLILQGKNIKIRGGEQNVQMRLESLRWPLTKLGDYGEPRLVVHPRCKNVRKAFLGAYYYRRLATNAERFSTEPEKNHPFSDLMDGLEYRAVEHFGSLVVREPAPEHTQAQPKSYQGRSRVTGY